MSQNGILKLKYIIDKTKEKKLFDFVNISLNQKDFEPNERFFSNYEYPDIAKKFFYDLRYYDVPENIYRKKYSEHELDKLSNLIINEFKKDSKRKYIDKKYIDIDTRFYECIAEPIGLLNRIKYSIKNVFVDVKKSKIKEELLKYKQTTFNSNTGELYINTEFSRNSQTAWYTEIVDFFNENRDKTKMFKYYFNYDFGIFVEIFENNKIEHIQICGEERHINEVYDHNGYFIENNEIIKKLPDELPFYIDWTSLKDIKILESFIDKKGTK